VAAPPDIARPIDNKLSASEDGLECMKDTRQEHIRKDWEHVHVCAKCGNMLHPDEIELGSIVLGVITCPRCEWSGPINLQIIERKDDPAS
jgi:hypothetical protein